MATLIDLAVSARRKLGLEAGEHTITCSTNGNTADILSVNDVLLHANTSAAYGEASFQVSATAGTHATNIKNLINAVFSSDTNIVATVNSAVVTITGARTVSLVNENSAGQYVISSTNTTDEPPFFSDMVEWVKEAELDIANKVIDEAFLADGADGIIEEVSIDTSGGAGTSYALPTGYLRAIELRYQTSVGSDVIKRAERVPYDLLQDIRVGDHAFYKTYGSLPVNQRWYSIYGGNIELGQNAAAHASTAAKMLYVKKPQTVSGTASDLPEFLHKTVITYVCAQSLYQLGKDQEANLMMQLYEQGIQAANGRYSSISEKSFEQPK